MAHPTAKKEPVEGGHVLFSQLLRNPYQAFLTQLYARLAAAGYADTSPSWGHNIFFYLREGGLRLTELAERAHTTKQAMRYTVNQLEAAGYVERDPSRHEPRGPAVALQVLGEHPRGDGAIVHVDALDGGRNHGGGWRRLS